MRDEAEGLDTNTTEGKKLKAEIEALSDKMVELTNNTKASTDALDDNAAEASTYDSVRKEMRSAVDDYAESLTYLEDIESKVADGQSLNRDEMIKLKETYPELESAIYKTANGWSVKLDKLKEVQLAEKQTTLVNAENAKKRVQTALEEALAAHRIGKFAMQTYADLWSAMDGRNIHGKVTRRDGTTVIINDSEYDRITSMYSNMKLAELEAEKNQSRNRRYVIRRNRWWWLWIKNQSQVHLVTRGSNHLIKSLLHFNTIVRWIELLRNSITPLLQL